MNRRFSLATLLLLMAVVSVWMASIRPALVEFWAGKQSGASPMAPFMLAAVGAIAGGVFSFAVAIWNDAGSIKAIVAVIGGAVLGAAAGVQMTVPAAWSTVFIAPIIVLAIVTLVGVNRRRQIERGQVERGQVERSRV